MNIQKYFTIPLIKQISTSKQNGSKITQVVVLSIQQAVFK